MKKLTELEKLAIKKMSSKKRTYTIKSGGRRSGKCGVMLQKELYEKLKDGQRIWMSTPYIESAKFRFKEVTGKRLYFYECMKGNIHEVGLTFKEGAI